MPWPVKSTLMISSDPVGGQRLRVLDGTSGFRRDVVKAAAALGATDERHTFAVAEWNGDGRLDLVVLQKSGTSSGRTEARVLAG